MGKSRRLLQWFGANTENADEPGRLLEGCRFVGIPFAGGMSEVPFITAKQILVNDLHRHVINLCRIVATDTMRAELVRRCDSMPYHPDSLELAQRMASNRPQECDDAPCLLSAVSYFICVWMGRGGKAGTSGEFRGALPMRWNAGGGGSNRRYRTAIEALDEWGKAFRRCEFTCMDAFDFFDKWQDVAGHGLFVDANWPGDGDEYTHKLDEAGQRRLADVLHGFTQTHIVVRYGEHPLVRELYHADHWKWLPMESRTQSNKRKPEFLICNK